MSNNIKGKACPSNYITVNFLICIRWKPKDFHVPGLLRLELCVFGIFFINHSTKA